MVDLDELDRLHASATPGEWRASASGDVYTRSDMSRVGVRYANSWAAEDKDITYVVAMHNAYPALAAEVRALREVAAEARDLVDELPSHAYECPQRAESDHVPARCRCHAGGRADLRAALAKVPR